LEQPRAAFNDPNFKAKQLLDWNSWMKGYPRDQKPIIVEQGTANKLSGVANKSLK
jgi:hypothetical protein